MKQADIEEWLDHPLTKLLSEAYAKGVEDALQRKAARTALAAESQDEYWKYGVMMELTIQQYTNVSNSLADIDSYLETVNQYGETLELDDE